MKIITGSDFYGFPLKESVKEYLQNIGYEVTDCGVDSAENETPYYSIASSVAKRIINGEFERGILICGTGMGMSIIANKHPGIYASVCESTFAAEKSRSINNSNVLTLGAMVTTDSVAKEIVDVWLKTEFTEGWDVSIKNWLHNSLDDISAFEEKQFDS